MSVIIRPSAPLPRLCGGVACQEIPDGSVWVFGGDSITSAQLHTVYVESYFYLRFPTKTFHFRGEGRGGAQITDLTTDGRYDKRIYSWLPTHVSSMFGHNGSPTDQEYLDQTTDLVDNYIITKNSAVPVLWGPHPTHTSTGKPSLGGYSTQLVNFGTTRGYIYADIWHTLQPIFAANVADPTPVDLGYIGDTIHPGPAGQLIIAYELLAQMQAVGDVSAVTINASGPTLTSAHHARVSSLTANAFSGVDFTRKDSRLPMAIDDAARVALDLMPEIADQNRYMLTVTGLSAGTYDIYCGGELMDTATHTELAAGWNMWPLTDGPIYDQLIEVIGRIRDKEGVSRTKNVDSNDFDDILPRVGVAKYQSNADALYPGLTGAALAEALAPNRAECNALDALIHSAAQPVSRIFSLRKQ